MKSTIRILSLVFVLYACIDPFYLPEISAIERFVVEGELTNETGPHHIRLFYSRSLEKVDKSNVKVESGAIVWIESDSGEKDVLQEDPALPGTYLTHESFKGEFGKSYRLQIQTQSQRRYESTWELLQPPGEINDLYYEFAENIRAPEKGKVFDSYDGFHLFANAASSKEANGLLRWRWTGVYKGITNPELNTKFVGRAELPDPLPCSGYVISSTGLEQVAECICCTCWGYEYSRSATVSNNQHIKDNSFGRVHIGTVYISRPRFHERYYVELEQLSVSENSYTFWKLASDQQQGTGSLFQPNSVRIKGNIISLSDPTEEVLGIFSASGIVRKSLFIERSAIPYELAPMEPPPSDCRKTLPNGTNVKPDFW